MTITFKRMSTTNEIRLIYKAAVDAVRPGVLVNHAVKCSDNIVGIQNELEFTVNKNCHVIGFGKAILAMALQMDEIIGQHTVKGIISIPHGVAAQYSLPEEFLNRYTIYEGAVNNVLDESSVKATKVMEDMVSNLTANDLLFVLVSGGGSALLASPAEGLSLDEKQNTIQLLSKSGANIQELNSVRKKLSRIKGGKLAQLSYPAPTIALILSDVIGDPLDVIASGPTVKNMDLGNVGLAIVQKYQLGNQLPTRVVECLSSPSHSPDDASYSHVRNYLIGSNLTALQAAEAYANQIGFATAIISDHIHGEAKEIGQQFAKLARILAQMMTTSNDQHEHMEELSVAAEHLHIDPRYCCTLERLLRRCRNTRKNLCLIGGGETTVLVRGPGVGGRNQEMVLSYLVESATEACLIELDTVFLSAGTDGIDGPTGAAGALACQGQFVQAETQGLNPRTYLDNNDSYHFFRLLQQGNYHLITGPSGTNVMDIHILCFNWK